MNSPARVCGTRTQEATAAWTTHDSVQTPPRRRMFARATSRVRDARGWQRQHERRHSYGTPDSPRPSSACATGVTQLRLKPVGETCALAFAVTPEGPTPRATAGGEQPLELPHVPFALLRDLLTEAVAVETDRCERVAGDTEKLAHVFPDGLLTCHASLQRPPAWQPGRHDVGQRHCSRFCAQQQQHSACPGGVLPYRSGRILCGHRTGDNCTRQRWSDGARVCRPCGARHGKLASAGAAAGV